MKLYLLAFVAILTGGILAFAPAKEKPFSQTFKYTGPSGNPDYLNPDNWTTSGLTACPGDGDIKCLVTPISGSILTVMDLVEEIEDNGFQNILTNDSRP